jgi:hypothetical protein
MPDNGETRVALVAAVPLDFNDYYYYSDCNFNNNSNSSNCYKKLFSIIYSMKYCSEQGEKNRNSKEFYFIFYFMQYGRADEIRINPKYMHYAVNAK